MTASIGRGLAIALAGKLREDWQKGNVDAGATGELLAVLRNGIEEETADGMVSLIQRGISPQSVWDALMCGAAVLMRSPGIVPLHAVTTTNAIRYMSERSRSDDTRRMLLLQNGSFLPFLRSSRGSNARVDQLAPIGLSASGDLAVSEIFATIGRDKQLAARQVLGYLARTPARSCSSTRQTDSSS